MSIRKRSWTNSKGKAKSAWQVDYRDNAGVRRSKQFARKKDAEAWCMSAAWQVSQGLHTPDSQSITVEEAANNWLTRADNDELERSTITSYEATARLHIIPYLGNVKLSQLSRPMVEGFRDQLLQTRSRSMVQRTIRYLAQIIDEAMRLGMIAVNPAKGVKVRQGRKEPITFPSKDELLAIINACGREDHAFFLIVIFTGLRASELRGLAWSNIDFAQRTLKVTQRADSWNQIGPPKSEAGSRTIPLPDSALNALRAWKLASPLSKMDLVFPSTNGTPQSYSNLMKRKVHPIQIKAGVSVLSTDRHGEKVYKAKYGLHAFRHAAASAWIDQNIDLKRLQSWMGHKNIQITIDTYGHLMNDTAKDASFAAASERELFSQ